LAFYSYICCRPHNKSVIDCNEKIKNTEEAEAKIQALSNIKKKCKGIVITLFLEFTRECQQLLKETKEDKSRLKELTKGEINYKGCIIKVRQNDIIDEPVDAIVNPANSELTNGGGAAKAIEDAGGRVVRDQCFDYIQQNKQLSVGKAIVTDSGELPCKKIIHVVGPKCEKNQKDFSIETKQLEKVIKNILKLTVKNKFKVVSILAVSTGIYHYPLKE
jgi:O-acetyl-ADP-ribose deacetylase (regulator of RNase III)